MTLNMLIGAQRRKAAGRERPSGRGAGRRASAATSRAPASPRPRPAQACPAACCRASCCRWPGCCAGWRRRRRLAAGCASPSCRRPPPSPPPPTRPRPSAASPACAGCWCCPRPRRAHPFPWGARPPPQQPTGTPFSLSPATPTARRPFRHSTLQRRTALHHRLVRSRRAQPAMPPEPPNLLTRLRPRPTTLRSHPSVPPLWSHTQCVPDAARRRDPLQHPVRGSVPWEAPQRPALRRPRPGRGRHRGRRHRQPADGARLRCCCCGRCGCGRAGWRAAPPAGRALPAPVFAV